MSLTYSLFLLLLSPSSSQHSGRHMCIWVMAASGEQEKGSCQQSVFTDCEFWPLVSSRLDAIHKSYYESLCSCVSISSEAECEVSEQRGGGGCAWVFENVLPEQQFCLTSHRNPIGDPEVLEGKKDFEKALERIRGRKGACEAQSSKEQCLSMVIDGEGWKDFSPGAGMRVELWMSSWLLLVFVYWFW